ncbi:protoporphyrinogen oxidase [soil metagenome]
MKTVTIIGAGFSGLVAAWRLQKQGYAVSVIEAKANVGGLISTLNHPMGLVETAANGLLASALVEELFTDCGLRVQTPRKTAKRRFLAVDGKLQRLPLTFVEAFRAGLKAFRIRSTPPRPRETVREWGERAVGQAVTGKILSTAMLGIYAAPGSELSAMYTVGRYFDPDRATVKGKMRGTVSAPGGMGMLIQRLRATLERRGVKFETSNEADSDVLLASRALGPVVIALSAWSAAKLLSSASASPALQNRAKLLAEIESIGLVTVTLFFNEKPPKLGFGTLFSQTPPHGESDGVLGCLQSSEIFEGRVTGGQHAETWILGGREKGDEFNAKSDEELLSSIYLKRDRMIQPMSRGLVVGQVITRWPRAIPFYGIELETIVPQLTEALDGTVLFGNYLGDLGLASILERTGDLVRRVNNI